MGLVEILTIVFIVLKLVGVIDWSWWLVFLPCLLVVGIDAFFIVAEFIEILKEKWTWRKRK